MNAEALSPLATNVTIISSVIAIASVTICAIVTSLITQHGAKRIKQTELFFHEKTQAYYEFLRLSDRFDNNSTKEQVLELSSAASKALLFASKDTEFQMRCYINAVTNYLDLRISNPPEASRCVNLVDFHREELIKSMRKDLTK